MNIEIKRVERIEPVVRSGARIFASFDVVVGDVEIAGVSLVQYNSDNRLGLFAIRQPASPRNRGGHVRFAPSLRDQITEAAAQAFEGIGGTFPAPVPGRDDEPTRKRIWVCAPPGYHPDETPDEIADKWSAAIDAVTGAVDRAERHKEAREEAARACG